MVYVYKILMNSLYGRFGINPESMMTVICDKEKYDSMLMMPNFIDGLRLSEKYYIVSYISNKLHGADTDWNPPRLSAVQLSAAITACSRIHMYPFISRPDCYYTDTDSVILGSPLEDEFISSTELGKFKLEGQFSKGIFLAPKTYTLVGNDTIIKYKGAAKAAVTFEWFESQYKDLSLINYAEIDSHFRINWKKMQITKQTNLYRLATPDSPKRERLYDKDKNWIDTLPKEVKDYDGQDNTVYKLKLKEMEHLLKEKKKERIRKRKRKK